MVLAGLTFITMFALYLPQPLTPNFLQNERQLNLQQIGLVGTFGSLGTVFTMFLLGHLNAPLAFLIGQPLVALFALLIWRGTGLPFYAIGYFFVSGYRLCRSMVLALARPLIHPSETGLAFGTLETANAVAVILAPILAGILYQRWPVLVYIVSLGLIGLTMVANIGFLPVLSRTPKYMPHEEKII